jgi:hypothetical protein
VGFIDLKEAEEHLQSEFDAKRMTKKEVEEQAKVLGIGVQ